MQKNKINIKGTEITLISKNEDDFISITDIAKYKNKDATGLVISHWLSAKYTIEFIGFWEQMHNPDFNVTEFSNIRNEAGSNGYVLSSKQWKCRDGKNEISKELRFQQLSEIALYQTNILNSKDYMKAIKRANETTYIDEQKRIEK